MTADEAKEILLRSRKQDWGGSDVELNEAFELMRQDQNLTAWWVEHQSWVNQTQAALRTIEPPPGLRETLLGLDSCSESFWSRRRSLWAMAASVALILGGLAWITFRSGEPDRPEVVWRQRMARIAIREYRMDIATNSLPRIEELLKRSDSPIGIELPTGVKALPLVGGAALRFRNEPVTMLCFDRGDGKLLWIFAIRSSALGHVPPLRKIDQGESLATATWASGDLTLLVAIEGSEQLLQSFL